ncbi:MAG: hypothetical protein AB1626_03060 [Candidatus Micrarchaeota archaeon]
MCLDRIKWGKAVLCGIAFAVISQVVYTIEAMLDMQYYTDPANFALWSGIMMPNQGPPGTEFLLLSIAFAFVSGLIFAAAFHVLRNSFEKDALKAGAAFGVLLFFVATLPGMLATYLNLAVPAGLVASWTVAGLVVNVLGGAAIGKISG